MRNPPGFRLYPRGFMGAVPYPAMPPTQSNTMLIRHQASGQISLTTPAPSDVIANNEITELYEMYIRQSGAVTSTEFRDKVLKQALSAFGTTSFFRWVVRQTQSPGCGDLQFRYLADTLNFIGGARRTGHQDMWSLVVVAGKPSKPSDEFIKAFEQFFNARPEEPKARQNDALIDVIQMWCSRRNGIEDLLQTLHLLFGNP